MARKLIIGRCVHNYKPVACYGECGTHCPIWSNFTDPDPVAIWTPNSKEYAGEADAVEPLDERGRWGWRFYSGRYYDAIPGSTYIIKALSRLAECQNFEKYIDRGERYSLVYARQDSEDGANGRFSVIRFRMVGTSAYTGSSVSAVHGLTHVYQDRCVGATFWLNDAKAKEIMGYGLGEVYLGEYSGGELLDLLGHKRQDVLRRRDYRYERR